MRRHLCTLQPANTLLRSGEPADRVHSSAPLNGNALKEASAIASLNRPSFSGARFM